LGEGKKRKCGRAHSNSVRREAIQKQLDDDREIKQSHGGKSIKAAIRKRIKKNRGGVIHGLEAKAGQRDLERVHQEKKKRSFPYCTRGGEEEDAGGGFGLRQRQKTREDNDTKKKILNRASSRR